MFLEAFTVCVGYDDFLDVCLPINKGHFDKWVIVTSPEDVKTKKVCKKNEIVCVESHRFFEDNAYFNKGKALNDVLHHLTKQGWLIHLDADILLPSNFRKFIESTPVDPEFIYGATRKEISLTHKTLDLPHQDKALPQGVAFPFGYFQMFTIQSQALEDKPTIFPETYPDAGDYDKEFMHYWKNKKKMLNIDVLHIFHGELKTNWMGRKSKRLTTDVINAYTHLSKKSGKTPLL